MNEPKCSKYFVCVMSSDFTEGVDETTTLAVCVLTQLYETFCDCGGVGMD